MDCKARIKAIQEAKTFADAEPLLKGLGPSAVLAVRMSKQIREAQPQLADEFMATAIKELEKLQEYEGGQSAQASNRANPLPREDTVTPDGEKPDTGATGTENQMREDIMGQLHPAIASQLMPQQMPGMSLPQQVQQMQYTVERAVKPLIKEIQALKTENQSLREAVTAVDKKITETQTKSVALEITKKGGIKETVPLPQGKPTVGQQLGDVRREISELDSAMTSGLVSTVI